MVENGSLIIGQLLWKLIERIEFVIGVVYFFEAFLFLKRFIDGLEGMFIFGLEIEVQDWIVE